MRGSTFEDDAAPLADTVLAATSPGLATHTGACERGAPRYLHPNVHAVATATS